MLRLSLAGRLATAKRAWEAKGAMYGILSECYHYALPGLSPMSLGLPNDVGMGDFWPVAELSRSDQLLDGTMGHSAEKLANTVVSSAFPQGRHWAKLRIGDDFGAEGTAPKQRRKELADLERKAFRAVHSSNFYLAATLMALEAVVAGTGYLKISRGKRPGQTISFEVVSQAAIALEGASDGTITGYYRKLEVTNEDLRRMWPEATRLPKDPMERMGTPTRYTVYESTRQDAETGKWLYHVDLAGDRDNSGREARELLSAELPICPWVSWRYALQPGAAYGRSPCMVALAHARVLEAIKSIRLRAASIRSVGAWTAKDHDTINADTTEFTDGAIINVGSNDQVNPTLRALELPGDPSMVELIIEDERNMLRLMLLDNALPPPTRQYSATEILERQRDVARAFGAAYTRLIEEVGRPVLRAVLYYLGKKGDAEELEVGTRAKDAAGDPGPLQLDGTDVEVVFENPMAEAQQLTEVLKIARWIEIVKQAGPEALLSGVHVERLGAVTGTLLDIDEELIQRKEEAAGLIAQLMAQGQGEGGPGAPAPAMGAPGGMA